MLLETYTSLDDEGIKKCLPKFLNVVEEVTGKPEYSMFNLSLKEDWKNSKKYCNDMPGNQSLSTRGSCFYINGLGVSVNGQDPHLAKLARQQSQPCQHVNGNSNSTT
jgi:hypothetical protein